MTVPTPTPVWFVVAASSGFGREIALNALQRGHTVIATARQTKDIQQLADAGAHVMAFDVTWPAAKIDDVAKDVFSKHGRVDFLVNTAGYCIIGAVEEVSPQEYYDCFNTNVFGVLNTLRAFLPLIRAQTVAPNGVRSTVMTFGSLASWSGGASYSIYAMTKASVSSLAESLNAELAPFKIRAVAVEPGYFRTSFLSPGAKMESQVRIPAYNDEDTPSGQVKRYLVSADGTQPGDVVKGSSVIVDAVTGTGVAQGKDLPTRMALGTDCEQVVQEKCAQSTAMLKEWGQIVRSTDHGKKPQQESVLSQ